MLGIDRPKIISFSSKVFLAGCFFSFCSCSYFSPPTVSYTGNVISAFNYELNFCTWAVQRNFN